MDPFDENVDDVYSDDGIDEENDSVVLFGVGVVVYLLEDL